MEEHLSRCSGHFVYLYVTSNLVASHFNAMKNPTISVSLAANLGSSTITSPWFNENIFPTRVPAFVPFQSLGLQSDLYAPGRVIYLYTNLDHVTPQLNCMHLENRSEWLSPPLLITVWLLAKIEPWGSQFLFPGRAVLSYFLVAGTLLEAKEQKHLRGVRRLPWTVGRGLLRQPQGSRL